MINLIAAAAFTILFNNSMGEDVYNSQAAQLSFDVTDSAYVWASYGQGRQDRLTQRMGEVQTYGGGIGYRAGAGFFIEAGYLDQRFDSDSRVAQEVAYHYFTPTFGIPGFADNWSQVDYIHDPKGDVTVRLGFERRISNSFIGVVSYQYFRPQEYWRVWNPDYLVDGAEGGEAYPYWEGNSRVNNSALQIGIKYEF